MPQDIYIKNIEQIVARKLKDLQLKPQLPLAKFKKEKKRFYSTPCRTKKGTTVFFKIIINRLKKENLPYRIKKEIDITNFLEPFAKKSQRLNIPVMIKYNKDEYPQWFLREYFPGPLMGHHFKISKQGLKKEVREGAVDNILSLQEIGTKTNLNLEKMDFDFYIKRIREVKDALDRRKDTGIDFEAIMRFFQDRKGLFSEENFVLSHNDFTLANLFIYQGRVFLNDWEQIRIGNLASDIALMWLQTYQYPQWRRELITYFVSKKNSQQKAAAKELFQLMVIYRALLQYLSGSAGNNKKIKDMCQKTIAAALKSFDLLIKI